jgi:hypothetical protein
MDGIDFTRGEPGMIENGFNIVYEEFDDIQLKIIKNNNDIRLFNWVTYSFTNEKIEVPLDYFKCNVAVSKLTFNKFIEKLIIEKYIMKINHELYRLNPFVYIPSYSDGAMLQDEWEQLI